MEKFSWMQNCPKYSQGRKKADGAHGRIFRPRCRSPLLANRTGDLAIPLMSSRDAVGDTLFPLIMLEEHKRRIVDQTNPNGRPPCWANPIVRETLRRSTGPQRLASHFIEVTDAALSARKKVTRQGRSSRDGLRSTLRT
jgi:hypothetical protein